MTDQRPTKKVLVTDKLLANRDLIRNWLQAEYIVLVAKHLIDANSMVDSDTKYDLIILDDVELGERLFREGKKVLITSVVPGELADVPRLPKPFSRKEFMGMRESFMAKVREIVPPNE